MLIDSVSVTYGRKINLGNYNNANLEVTIEAKLELGEDLHQAMSQLWTMAKANVRAQAIPLLSDKNKDTSHIFLGLEVTPVDGVENPQAVNSSR